MASAGDGGEWRVVVAVGRKKRAKRRNLASSSSGSNPAATGANESAKGALKTDGRDRSNLHVIFADMLEVYDVVDNDCDEYTFDNIDAHGNPKARHAPHSQKESLNSDELGYRMRDNVKNLVVAHFRALQWSLGFKFEFPRPALRWFYEGRRPSGVEDIDEEDECFIQDLKAKPSYQHYSSKPLAYWYVDCLNKHMVVFHDLEGILQEMTREVGIEYLVMKGSRFYLHVGGCSVQVRKHSWGCVTENQTSVPPHDLQG